MAVGQGLRRLGSADPFGDGTYSSQDVGQLLSLTKLHADSAVAAQRPRAGQDQIAHAGQAGEGTRVGPHRRAQTDHFGKPPRDESGAAVVAETKTVHNAGGQRDHIFQRAAELHADGICAQVHAERSRHEYTLQRFRLRTRRPGQDDRRREVPAHFHGKTRTREREDGSATHRQHLFEKRRHEPELLRFDPLRRGDDRHASWNMRGERSRNPRGRMGRHHKNHQLYAEDRFFKRRGRSQSDRQGDAGKVQFVLMIGDDPGGDLRLERPEPDPCSLLGQETGQGRPPRPRADDRRRTSHFKMSWSTASRSSLSVNSTDVSIRSGISSVAWKETWPMGRVSCWVTPSATASGFSGRISSIFSTSGTMLELSNLPYARTTSWMMVATVSLWECPVTAGGNTFTTDSPFAVSFQAAGSRNFLAPSAIKSSCSSLL